MAIQIIINADNAEAAKAEMRALVGFPEGVARHKTDDGVIYATISGKGPASTIHTAGDDVEAPAPTPAADAPKKRGRPAKAAAPAPEPEAPPQAISQTPENREDPEETEEADEADEIFGDEIDDEDEDDMIGGYAVTIDGVKAAMLAYKEKFGMDVLTKHGPALLGFGKVSDLVAADDLAKTAAAVRNFVRAVESGKAVGA